jgi:LmbE family N-acetylglucosaminyl deacetylase
MTVQLAEVRRRELELSAAILGVDEVLFLGQADGPIKDWRQADTLDQFSLTAALEHIVERYDPDVILSHGPLGGYGHSAHRTVHRCVMAAAKKTAFRGSIFSFCGQTRNAFFSWHFDEPSSVTIDARGFLPRRAASLRYHQSQREYFLQPHFPRTIRKVLSAAFGLTFFWTEAGRKRVPIATATRFFTRFPIEGLVLQQAPASNEAHFFLKNYADDCRVQNVR